MQAGTPGVSTVSATLDMCDNVERLILAELGDKLGVTWERVRQIEAEALTKLRGSQDTKRLKEYLD